jgi:hypothetical protein
VKIDVFRNGRFLKNIERPVHKAGTGREVTYKSRRYIVMPGNRIEIGTHTALTSESTASPLHLRSDAPGDSDWTHEQRSIITAPPSARLIVEAAPGTGKTAVACARVAYLLASGISPSGIWLISFTRTAIQEIRNRIAELSHQTEAAYGVRVATIDSHAWQLRQGFEGSARNAFSSFEDGIDAAIDLLRDPDDDVVTEIESIQHLIIDEAQDVVGQRREMLLSLIDLLSGDAGVTVLGDPAQAIYGFTEDESPIAGDLPLPEALKADTDSGFEVKELTEVIRTASLGLRRIFVDTRKVVLHAGTGSMEKLLQDLRANCDGPVEMEVSKNRISGRDNVLVLYRRRSEVLTSGAYLAGEGTPFRVRMSGYPSRIAPWLAAIFWDWTAPTISESDFRSRYTERLSPHWKAPTFDLAWKALVRHAGRSHSVIDVRRLREILGRSQPPLDFAIPELGESGPILGTIHASKGREADEVHLMLAELQGEELGDAEELKVVFVGATRARSVLRIGKAGGRYASKTPSGRRFHLARNKMGAQIEFGMDGDINELAQVSRQFNPDPVSTRVVQMIISGSGAWPLPCKLRNVALGGGNYSWRLYEPGSESPIAEMHERVNDELWKIIKMTASKRGSRRVHPSSTISNVFLTCCRTIVRPHSDPGLPLLHEPWASSGFWLAPVIFSYSTVAFYNG